MTYENMSLSELKDVARSKGLKGYSGLKKDELVEYLRSGKLQLKKDKSKVDKIGKRELQLWIDNNERLYTGQHLPMIKNLDRKQINGTYDREKAVKLFLYLIDAGAKDYTKNFGGNWNITFNRDTRISLARSYVKSYEEDSKYDLELKNKIMKYQQKKKKQIK